jgi:hypothetical protein
MTRWRRGQTRWVVSILEMPANSYLAELTSTRTISIDKMKLAISENTE